MLNKIDKLAIITAIVLTFLAVMAKLSESKVDIIKNPITQKSNYQKIVNVGGKKSLIIKSDQQGHYLIDGKINNIPVKFIVDTGASTVGIPIDIAKKANLKKIKEVLMSTPSGTEITSSTIIPSLIFGPFHLKNFDGIMVSSDLEFVLLGSNALENFQITQKKGVMIIEQ